MRRGPHPSMRPAMRASLLALALLALAPAVALAQAAPPRVETQATIATYEPETGQVRTDPRVATGPSVVSAADPRAAEAGAAMLRAGGNAADAAIATMIALTVVEPQSSGIGGGAFLVHFDPATGETVTIDGRETAPAAAGPTRFLKPDGAPMSFREAVPGGLSVGVPGAIRLAAEAHKRWGSLPWARLFEPSIALARDGFVVSERLNRFTGFRADMLAAKPEAAAIFLGPDGKPWPEGHVLKQPELARTLGEVAAAGPEAFYSGRIAAAIEQAVATAPSNAARLTAADLAGYRARVQPPVCGGYRGYRICSMGPSSSGGVALLQILGQLERFDLGAMGPDNLLTWHLIAESMRLAFADREAWGGDAAFADIPVAGLVSPGYLAERSALIRMDRAMAEARAGTPPGVAPRPQARLADVPATSHLVAADSAGRVANLTSTIEAPFGSGLVAAGFVLNNELTDFDFEPARDGVPAVNRVEPGKRPRSSMTPTLVFAPDGQLVGAFGAAGGATIIAQVAKAIIAWIDWGRPVEAALGTPQIMADRRGLRYEKDTMLERFAAGWKALGHHPVEAATLPLKANAAVREGGMWRGAADPRSEGAAIAVGEGDSR